MFFQSGQEGPNKVPCTGLESITRVRQDHRRREHAHPSDLVRPPEPPNGVIAPLAPRISSTR
jgi:hypothetical protein